jgi:hypothetical protein
VSDHDLLAPKDRNGHQRKADALEYGVRVTTV